MTCNAAPTQDLHYQMLYDAVKKAANRFGFYENENFRLVNREEHDRKCLEHRALRREMDKVLRAVPQPDDVAAQFSPDVCQGNLNCIDAIEAMKAGHIVRRFNGNLPAKFHRMENGLVQTADSVHKITTGEWVRDNTDITSWVDSTFRVVTSKVVRMVWTYADDTVKDAAQD